MVIAKPFAEMLPKEKMNKN